MLGDLIVPQGVPVLPMQRRNGIISIVEYETTPCASRTAYEKSSQGTHDTNLTTLTAITRYSTIPVHTSSTIAGTSTAFRKTSM